MVRIVLVAIALSVGYAGAPRASAQAVVFDPVLSDFQHRVNQYMQLHDEQHAAVIHPDSSRGVAANRASSDAVAARIRAARADARPGDIFTAPIAARVRSALNAELRGPAAANTRAAIRDDGPAKFTLRVNDPYPDGASLPTTPANVLAALPAIPSGLEYRIVDRHLILRDVDANIIVDYLFDVMCGSC